MMWMEIFQWLGALLGVTGAWLMAGQTPQVRLVAFGIFTASNIALAIAFILQPAWPLLVMQGVFFITSMRGMRANYRAWVRAESTQAQARDR